MNKEVINFEDIKKLIPHREPFIYIDELTNIVKLKQATGIKTFNDDEGFFEGHFPDKPVVPGVILIEVMAQTAAALIAFSIRKETFDKIVYLMNIEKSKFRNPVFPRTKLFANVIALRSKGRVWKFEGEIHDSKNIIICNASWSAMIMDRDE